MDILDLYITSVKEIVPKEYHRLFNDYGTTLTMASFDKDSGTFQFRFETNMGRRHPKIAQYVTMGCDGIMKFRTDNVWFVPSRNTDICFDTFENAKDMVWAQCQL